LVTGATDDGREDGAGSVITGKTGLAHTGTIVHNQGSNFVVTHCKGKDKRWQGGRGKGRGRERRLIKAIFS
jgi:hypothetical protein